MPTTDTLPPAKKAKQGKGGEREAKKAKKTAEKSIIGQAELRKFENPAFVTYYKSQLQLSDDEWASMEASLRSPLPVTFRFSGNGKSAKAQRARMETALLPQMDAAAPHALPWYPDRLAWQIDLSRMALRGKDWEGADAPGAAGRSEAVKDFHGWLLRENMLGHVHRQEAVSMVPALVLDVQPGHTVFDACASPGSKAQQILELLAEPSNILFTTQVSEDIIRYEAMEAAFWAECIAALRKKLTP